ncbi:MAG TPA: MFS transporter [Acidocella sp.]|nr:MFS transporter [Acidocella sp.]
MDASPADMPIAPPAAGPDYTHADKLRVLSGIMTCILLAALDQTVVLPALPQMAASLHGGAHLSWVVSAYLLTTTATTPIYGKLSDQLGRQQVLIPAITLFLLACICCALANSVTALIIARAFQGIGGGALLSVSQAAIADVIPPRERGKYQGWLAGVWGFASVAGPIAGGFVVQHLSWRWIFWANLPIGAVAMFMCFKGLSGITANGRKSKIDYAGAVLLLISVTALLAALSLGGVDFAWNSAPIFGLFAVSLLMFGILATQQQRAQEPLFPGALVAKAGFQQINIISFLNSGAMFAAIFLLPLLLQGQLQAGAAASGLEIMPFLASMTVGAYIGGQTAKKTGKTRNIMVVSLFSSAATFGISGCLPLGAGVLGFAGIAGLYGLGIGAVMPCSIVTVQSQAAQRDMGAATGILLLLRSLGGAFGATMAGVLLAYWGNDVLASFRLGFFLCAGMMMLAAVTAMRMENASLRNTLQATPATQPES